MQIQIDQDRLMRELDALASYSDAPAPAVTRIVFSPTDSKARAYIDGLFSEAGLAVRKDAVGNTFARWVGADPSLPVVGTGSHIDAIPHAGRYDGTVGVLGGLEAIRALQRSGFRPRRSIELLLFTSEEPTRFGIGCLGSRLLSGSLSPEIAYTLRDSAGKTAQEVIRDAGYSAALDHVRLSPGYFHAFVELHIEQGPLLEQKGISVGIVTAIAAPATLKIEIDGEGGHAGAMLMPLRHDAFLAAAEIALGVEAAVKSTGAIDSVGTVGVCNIFPGAVNSVPSRCVIEVDVRDTDAARRDGVLHAIRETCAAVTNKRQVRISETVVNVDAPAQSSPFIVDALRDCCATAALESMLMVSRAYHDTLFISRISPAAMLFIPCRNGYSHRPDEYSSPQDIAAGVRILAHTLVRLAA